MTEVAVERDGPRLTYHHPSKLASTIGMEIITEQQAIDDGAVQCSQCFAEQDGVFYEFSYLDGRMV